VVDRIVVDVDESIEFQCIASGTPEPQIEWSRPGGVRLPSHAVVDNGFLRIRRVSREDQGEYVCTALNAAGQAQVTGVLVIREGKFTNQRSQRDFSLNILFYSTSYYVGN